MTSRDSENPKRLGEFAMIAKLLAPLAAAEQGALGLQDDAAHLKVPQGEELVLTLDGLIEGVHFFREDPPALVARKCLRVNLSDLAAKGARPRGYMMFLGLAPWTGDAWLTDFARGLGEDQNQFGLSLLGGDTTKGPGPLTVSITALGFVPEGRMITRGGAKAGESVFVTGNIGDAGAGLALLQGKSCELMKSERAGLISRYRLPEPRVGLGRRLLGLAGAALDLSDGLLADLGHIADVSGVRIAIESARIPLSEETKKVFGEGVEGVLRAASAGDDYEIAFTAPESAREALSKLAVETGVSIGEIGRVEPGEGVVLLDASSAPIPIRRAGYTHF